MPNKFLFRSVISIALDSANIEEQIQADLQIFLLYSYESGTISF